MPDPSFSPATALFILGGCVIAQGFFSGSEIALVAADRLVLKSRADAGDAAAARVLAMLQRPTRLVSTCIVGIAIASVAGATVLTEALSPYTQSPSIWVAVLIPPVTILFSEMVPKSASHQRATEWAMRVAPIIGGLEVLLRPGLWLIERTTRLVMRALGVRDGDSQTVRREDIQLLLDNSPSADIRADEREMILRVFNFSETLVQDAMRPLIEVMAISENASVEEAAHMAIEQGFSRLPVYRKRVDRIVGVVMHADLMFAQDPAIPVGKVMRDILFVPEAKRVDELFIELRRKRQRLAVVVDEYGGAVGLISIEDILEEIVGDIEDEFDRRRPALRRGPDGLWTASGRVETEALLAETSFELPEGDYETLAGFVLSRLGSVPPVGATLVHEGWTLTVTKATDRAIIELTLAPPVRAAAPR